jgi:dimethylargininase
MIRALVRAVPATFADALCASAPAQPIDVALARAQHAAYCDALAACGVAVEQLPADDGCPDCVFVEDTAVVVDQRALITRPGAPSRRGETAVVDAALGPHLELVRMTDPGTLDGGDVMRVGKTLYVGRSARTNADGVRQLVNAFPSQHVEVLDLPPGVLHLKCICSPLGGDAVLLVEGTVQLPHRDVVHVAPAEAYAANAVAIHGHVVVADGFPRTHDALAARGLVLHPVPVSEVRKADGSLTCQSIVFASV